MPFSVSDHREEIKAYIRGRFSHSSASVLDVGPGSGIYVDLLSDCYDNIDCVEIHEPYVAKFGLREKYRRVFVGDVREFDFEWYDLIILGDVLEHMSFQDARKLLTRIHPKCSEIIVSIPYLSEQGPCYDNAHERHVQNDLTHEVFLMRYPDLTCLIRNDRVGVYIKRI
jgi:2-polyprenyl-3-methyl-5-hydroxy-6-metoxy-1,4-benzoquinol methylase